MNSEIFTKKINTSYSITGMTCESCVKTITEKILAIIGVSSVNVNLKDKRVDILSGRQIDITEVRQALSANPKYGVVQLKSDILVDSKITVPDVQLSLLKVYKPLITVFLFIFIVSLSYQVNLGAFNSHIFMNHIMAGFFIGLSFFKFLDLKAFADSFSSYDPIAQRWFNYGYVYPFIELLLGALFIAGKVLILANVLTVAVLTATTYGVYKRLRSKSKFQCACLGTAFNLPLSNVTIAENLTMIFMSLYSINSLLKIV